MASREGALSSSCVVSFVTIPCTVQHPHPNIQSRSPESSPPILSRPFLLTQQKRALQTPWVELGDDQSRVIIRLPSHERSDELNFVLKELTSSTWYDFNGGNFAVPLKPQPHVAVRTRSPSPRPVSPASESNRVATFQQLPQQLCGIWAYIKWEFNGSPTRSQEESDAEYKKGIEEMKALLAFGGKTIDWLEQVGRGQIRYKDIQVRYFGGGW